MIDDFTTERLSIRHWSSDMGNAGPRLKLAKRLVQILTPAVLEHLPPVLQVAQRTDDVLSWMADRATESDVYLVSRNQDRIVIGLLLLVNDPHPGEMPTVHLGYLFDKSAWGRGYASELVGGLVKAARTKAPVMLLGGVAKANMASAHILRKSGFVLQPDVSQGETDVFAMTV